jgi:DNA-binding NarL/FixJ family response regulator
MRLIFYMPWKEKLSKRELEVSELISYGLCNDEIGSKLNISPHTVKTHLHNVYLKAGISNRTSLAIKFLRMS